MNKKLFIIILITIIALLSGCGSDDSNGYYNGIKWKTSFNDIKFKLGDDVGTSDNMILQVIDSYYDIDGTNAWVMYRFENNELFAVDINMSIYKDKTSLTDDELNKNLYQKFIKMYGECSESDSIEYTWNTKYSKITLMKNNNYIRYEMIEK